MNDGKLEEFVRKDKTDMEAEGTTFTMVDKVDKVTGTQIFFPKNLGE